MAFVDQVQDLTSLTVSDTDELSQFLKDGVMDITNRWLAIKPGDAELFARESSEQTSNGSLHLNGAKIVSIIREDGTNNQWRNCRKISPSLQYDVTDTESFNYASKINPAYMIANNGQISVFPTPEATTDAFKVYYVNNDPEDKSGANLIHSHSDIGYFPDDKVRLVVIYASMKLLQATMASKSIDTLSITAVPPETPPLPVFDSVVVASVAAGSFGTAPTYGKPSYTAPSVSGDGDEITDVSKLDTDNTVDVYADQHEFDQWWATAGHYIEGEEDTELAGAQVQKINAYINAYQAESTRRIQTYQADIQNELHDFNEKNAEYQANIKKSLQELQVEAQKAQKDADLDQQREITEYANKLQRYQSEIAHYQAEITTQVQEYQANVQEATTEYQWLQGQYALLKAEYEIAFGANIPPKGTK